MTLVKTKPELLTLGKPDKEDRFGNLFSYRWEGQGINVKLDRLREERGDVTGYIDVTASSGEKQGRVGWSKMDLGSSWKRNQFAKDLGLIMNTYDWAQTLHYVCHDAAIRFREGEPAVDTRTLIPTMGTRYFIRRFMPLHQTSIFYGDPESGKSLLAALIACATASDIHIPLPGGLDVLVHGRVLYLDWEADGMEQTNRFALISNGLCLLDPPNILHKYMSRGLADSFEEIASLVAQEDVALVVVDSLLPACSGNPNLPDVATAFCNSVRALGDKVTKLVIGQVGKAGAGSQDAQQIMSSVIFQYLGRANWEVRRKPIAGSEDFHMACYLRKKNNMPGVAPKGFSVHFDPDAGKFNEDGEPLYRSIDFTYLDVAADFELSSHLSLKTRIYNALIHSKYGLTRQELAGECDTTEQTITNALKGMSDVAPLESEYDSGGRGKAKRWVVRTKDYDY